MKSFFFHTVSKFGVYFTLTHISIHTGHAPSVQESGGHGSCAGQQGSGTASGSEAGTPTASLGSSPATTGTFLQ